MDERTTRSASASAETIAKLIEENKAMQAAVKTSMEKVIKKKNLFERKMATMKKDVTASVIDAVQNHSDHNASFLSFLIRNHPNVAHRSNGLCDPYFASTIPEIMGNFDNHPSDPTRNVATTVRTLLQHPPNAWTVEATEDDSLSLREKDTVILYLYAKKLRDHYPPG